MDRRRNFFYKLICETDNYHTTPVSLYNAAKNNKYLLQRLRLEKKLDVHAGCVNTICWNSTGRYLLSGSDDLHLCITDAFTNEIKARIRTGHATNIFSAKYLPNTNDTQVVSCSGDGVIINTDLNKPLTSHENIFNCQDECVYDIATVPNDSHTFLTCSHDHTVRWYDLRVKQSCKKDRFSSSRRCTDDVLIRCEHPATAIAVNQLLPWQLAIGCSDSVIRIYDRRMLSTKSLGGYQHDQDSSILAKFTYDGLKTRNNITSLAYSRDCQQLLASYSNDYLYLFNINDVRSTIEKGLESDMVMEDTDRQSCSFKRFRLRGDWSDTGPNALTAEDFRRSPPSTTSQATSSTINNTNSNTNNTSSSTATTTNSTSSNQSNSHSHDARLRHLNLILNLILRSNLREMGGGESSEANNNNNNNNREETQSDSERQSTTEQQSNSEMSVDPPPLEPATSNEESGGQNESNSENSSTNSQGLVIQIFEDEMDFHDDEAAGGTGNGGGGGGEDGSGTVATEDVEVPDDNDVDDDDDEFDSDTTNDSVFNHDSSANSTLNRRIRSRSSSSNDSRSYRFRRRLRSTQRTRQRRHFDTIACDDISTTTTTGGQKNRLRTFKINKFKTFMGHRNSRTVIKEATFWGDDYIISGSDCGHIFIWSIATCELVMIMEGDHHVVNCLQPHPTDPILASSGIDYDIKLWSPFGDDCNFDEKKARKIMDRNKQLLADNRETVTIPARFVLGLFSSLRNRQNQYQNLYQNEDSSHNVPLDDDDLDPLDF